MISLLFRQPVDRPLRVLCLGCHSDDIEIGCGGTILRLLHDYPDTIVTWVVFSADGERAIEAVLGATQFVGSRNLDGPMIKTFRDGFMPFVGDEVKTAFEDLKQHVSPDLVLTHWNGDAHQDHRLLSELTWNTFRDHLILEYEIPKYDGDMGRPNLFVPLSTSVVEKKVNLICEIFQTQSKKHWFARETFKSLMRLRGMECAAVSDYAEAFYVRKIVL